MGPRDQARRLSHARIDNGRVQLLTRTGLDWTAKYPGAAAALANLSVKTAYIDGELCGVDDAGLHIKVGGVHQLLEVDTIVICAGQEPQRPRGARY